MSEPSLAEPRLRGWARAALVYFEPKVLYVALLGFSSGLPLALTHSTLQAWMNRAGVDLTTIGFFALVGLPYSLKFVWAPFVDSVRLPWLSRLLGRRRSWLVASQAALAVALLVLAGINPAAAPIMLAIVALAVAFISATQDILVDTLRVEALEDRQQAAGVANYVAAYRVALLLTTSGALMLAGTLSDAGWGVNAAWGAVYLVAAAAVSIGVLGALLMPEPDTPDDAPRLSGRAALLFLLGLVAAIWALFYLRGTVFADHGRYFGLFVLALLTIVAGGLIVWRQRRRQSGKSSALGQQIQDAVIAPFAGFARDHKYWLGLLLLVVLFKFGDTFAGSLFTPFGQRLGFTDQAIGFALGWGIIATIVGGFLGAYILRWQGLLIAMWIAGIVQLVSNFGYFGLALIGANEFALMAAVLTENVMGGIGTTIFIALISALCRTRKYTASQFALLTALSAVPRTLLISPAGMVAEAVGWPVFFVLSAIAALPGIALLWWLGTKGAIREKDREPASGPAS